jgi:hypothetical protein
MAADYYGAFVASQNELAQVKFELGGRVAQLEDELNVAKSETLAAYEFVKPPVNIDTSTKTIVDSAGGAVALPDAARSSALAVVSVVVGVVGVLLTVLLMKRKGR